MQVDAEGWPKQIGPHVIALDVGEAVVTDAVHVLHGVGGA
jgi:hypothetical protein